MVFFRLYCCTCTFALTGYFAPAATGQEDAVKIRIDTTLNYPLIQSIFKTNPFTWLWGPFLYFTSEYRIALEVTSSYKQSTQVAASYLGKGPIFRAVYDSLYEEIIIRGGRFQISHRFFLTGLTGKFMLEPPVYAPVGFYLSPHLSYSTVRVSAKVINNRDMFIRGTHFNINLLGGCQLIVMDALALDFFAGVGYKNNFWIAHDPQNTVSIDELIKEELESYGRYYFGPLKLSLGFQAGLVF